VCESRVGTASVIREEGLHSASFGDKDTSS